MTDSVKKYPYLSILGPTASGKSSLALRIAEEFDGEIVSCDSVQLYKGFDIGSAKPSLEEQEKVKHHMIGLLDPVESYDASRYAKEARKVIKEILSRGKLPVVVGGTGLYYRFLVGENVHSLPKTSLKKENLKSLSSEELHKKLSELDPERARTLHENDRYRLIRALDIALNVEGNFSEETKREQIDSFAPELCFLLDPPRKLLHQRIEKRAEEMLKLGLVEEVQNLLKEEQNQTSKAMTTIGYKEVRDFLSGKLPTKEELLFRIICATRQYAKRQVTFFKKTSCDLRLEDSVSQFDSVKELIKSVF